MEVGTLQTYHTFCTKKKSDGILSKIRNLKAILNPMYAGAFEHTQLPSNSREPLLHQQTVDTQFL